MADSGLGRLRHGLAVLRIHQARAKPFRCPLCGPSILVRLDSGELAVRCLRCGATPIAMSIASALMEQVPDLRTKRVYELSARGPFHRFLQRAAREVVTSHYVEGAPAGSVVGGARVEDVQHLTFSNDSFDVCTATEVFEHVPDDRLAFAEVLRVLRPGGVFLFTVPLDVDSFTRERARIVGGSILHLAPPEYHRDPASQSSPVLSFRDYGHDITARLCGAGFAEGTIVRPRGGPWFGHRRPVVLGRKA